MKNIAVIQCNHIGWEGCTDVSLRKDANGRYVIEEVLTRARQLKCIDDAPVIACPDLPENRVFKEIAEQYGCHCFMGSNANVLDRLYSACVSRGGERIVWFQGIHYFLHMQKTEEMIAWMDREKFDYVRCPDATCKFSLGHSVTIAAIDRARSLIGALPTEQKQFYSSRPFAFMRSHPQDFRVGLFESFPTYDEQTLRAMREAATHIYVEERALHTEHACAIGDISRGRYLSTLEFVDRNMTVLDIACGTGYGSKLLAERARRVIGVDISAEAVEFANAHHRTSAEFRLGNAETIPVDDNEIDVTYSIGTIEHVDDDDAFVAELARVIRPGGRLIVYTPQNRMGALPIWPWHFREYSAPELRSLVARRFRVDAIWGWQNGVVTRDDERGDGMFLIATNMK